MNPKWILVVLLIMVTIPKIICFLTPDEKRVKRYFEVGNFCTIKKGSDSLRPYTGHRSVYIIRKKYGNNITGYYYDLEYIEIGSHTLSTLKKVPEKLLRYV